VSGNRDGERLAARFAPAAPGVAGRSACLSRALVAVTRREILWLTLLVAAAAALRVPGLFTGIWRDEGSTYFDATGPSIAAALREIRLGEINPPGYFLLMRAWLGLAGTSDLTMKAPSFVFGLALVPATFALGRAMGSRAAMLAAAFAALATQGIELSSDARPYTLAALLAAVAGAAAFRVLGAPAGERLGPGLVRYAAAAIALEYVSYTGLVMAFSLSLGALALALAFGADARRRVACFAFAGVNVGVAAALVPWLAELAGTAHVAAAWLEPAGWAGVAGRIVEQFGFALPTAFMRVQFALVLVVTLVVAAASRRAPPSAIAGGTALLAGLTIEALALLREQRYAFVFTPLADVLAAIALVALFRSAARFAAPRTRTLASGFAAVGSVALGVALLAGASAQARATGRAAGAERSGMRALTRDAAAAWNARTLVVVAPDYLGPSLGYYLRDRSDIRLVGFPNGDRPEYFRCCAAWNAPALVASAERALRARARGFDRLAFVYDPGAADRGALPFSDALALRARFARDFLVLSDERYPGELEPVAVTVFSLRPPHKRPSRSSTT
jgi:hypothetical protein